MLLKKVNLEYSRCFGWFIANFMVIFSLNAQIRPVAPAAKTWAVIVGIADYQDKRIPPLQYSHQDAQLFAEWLASPAGGNVPKEQMLILTNEEATNGKMIAAYTWLMEVCKSGDRAIIYFSGHGDMENQTVLNQGYLLAYDMPAANYMAGGFPLYNMQAIIRTLSMRNEAQVIVITDACRSGALAGEAFSGAQATSKVLADQFANETKILSCQPNESSLEGPQWGGGHGVFTWYLVDGLTGLADRNEDLKVTLQELQRYLEDHIEAAVSPKSQIPVIVGDKTKVLNMVDQASLITLQETRMNSIVNGQKGEVRERGVIRNVLSDSVVLELYKRFRESLKQGRLIDGSDDSAYAIYSRIHSHEDMLPYRMQMKLDLTAALQDEAQRAINDYLSANPAELSRRWQYDDAYSLYPKYLLGAKEILGEEHFMSRDLSVKALYFEGLNKRLDAEKSGQRELYEDAKRMQIQVLELDPAAAYAMNELGIIARRQGKTEESIIQFARALEYSPTWTLARSNLCGSMIDVDAFESGMAHCRSVLDQDSTFTLALYNLAIGHYKLKEYDKAIQLLDAAIGYEKNYIQAYLARLSILNRLKDRVGMKETLLVLDTILRSNRLSINQYYDYAINLIEVGRHADAIAPLKQHLRFFPEDLQGVYQLANALSMEGQWEEAAENFEKVVLNDSGHKDARFNLGFVLVMQGKMKSAQPYFEELINANQKHAEAHIGMALCLSSLGKSREANDHLKRGLKNGYNDELFLRESEIAAPLRNHKRFVKILKKYFPK